MDGLKAVLATTNEGKVRELRRALPGWTLDPIGPHLFPEETGETFAENAEIKARSGRQAVPADAWVIGEDSGLVVDALGGRPGVHSARWAGPDATATQWMAKLLAELEGVPKEERTARYVCTLVAIGPEGENEVAAEGVLEGSIADAPRGSGGFGYDPVFVPEGEERTVAELGDEWKAAHSHRARAAAALRVALEPL